MDEREEKRTQDEQTFGIRLKALMNERKPRVTQEVLAKKVGVVRQAISRYCNDDAMPDLQTLINIAKYFDTSTDYLLGNSKSRINADDLEVALKAIDAEAMKKITVLMEGEAYAGLRFINDLLNADKFYKALAYLNTACKIQRLKDVEPSPDSQAYMDAVKIDALKWVNALESTKEVVIPGDSAIEYYTDKATKMIGEILRGMVCDVKEKVDND